MCDLSFVSFGFVNCSPGESDKPYFAQDMKGLGMTAQEMPEWKKASFGGNKASYGKKTNLSILEQRQSLPIYKLRDELVKVGCFGERFYFILFYFFIKYQTFFSFR